MPPPPTHPRRADLGSADGLRSCADRTIQLACAIAWNDRRPPSGRSRPRGTRAQVPLGRRHRATQARAPAAGEYGVSWIERREPAFVLARAFVAEGRSRCSLGPVAVALSPPAAPTRLLRVERRSLHPASSAPNRRLWNPSASSRNPACRAVHISPNRAARVLEPGAPAGTPQGGVDGNVRSGEPRLGRRYLRGLID
jgi:hypothetical protein